MCGIWAVFGVPDFPCHFKEAMRISRRGPDSLRIETVPHFENCCLAFHRLAILGDQLGMQPLLSKQFPHLYLMCNGEIYNYKQLGEEYGFNFCSHTDTEIILHLYNKFGAQKTARLLDGVFAFCIVDTKLKEVHLGRDTFGVRPMFTLSCLSGEGPLAICSEAKGLVMIKDELETESSDDVQQFELKQFLPGNYASFSLSHNGTTRLLKCEPYTYIGKPPVFKSIKAVEDDDVFSNIRNLLTEAVRKRLMADRRLGCFLSGGLDSSLIAALLVKVAKEAGIAYPIQTFSIGLDGSTDVEAARVVAKYLGTEHHEIKFTAEEGINAIREVIHTLEMYDTITIRSSVVNYFLSKYVRSNTDSTVVFSGEGSDELCQGYLHFHYAPSCAESDAESRRLLQDLYLYDVLRCDRTTAAHGLELRVPFLDAVFTSYYLSLPAQMRQCREGETKWLLRKAFDGTGLLPQEILWRRKEGFSDGISSRTQGQSWFEILQREIENTVTDDEFAKASEMYPVNTPKFKEAYFYRGVFEEFFRNHRNFTPRYWMPKWCSATDPSPRTLPLYK